MSPVATGAGVTAAALFAAALVVLGVVPVPVLVLSIPFLVLLARRPVLRRLAVRNAVRRPRETALVLLGALLGTAIITGSAIVGDTLGASIRRSAHTQLGPVDMVVRAADGSAVEPLAQRIRALDSPRIDGVLPLTRIVAAVATAGAERRAEPDASIMETDFGAARAFGGDPEATGVSGSTPSGDRAVIGRDLAERLEVRPGDPIEVFAYGTSRRFVVDRVLDRLGVAGLHLGFGSESQNLFVPPGTIAELAAGRGGQGAPPTSLVLVSNRGGVIDGASLSPQVERELEGVVEGAEASVSPAKQDLLRTADEQGAMFTELFSSIGFFSVLAGILLLVNIFVMLAQERKTEMGMLRAVGLRRAGLVGSFSLEGWMYALVASALGTVAGLGVGRLIVLVTAGIFSSGPTEDFNLELHYTAELSSIQRGFTVGFVMSLVTVVATSLWVSRLNVIRAIRDLPEPTATKKRVLPLVLGAVAVVLGGLMTAGGFADEDPFRILAGPAVLALGAVPLLGRLVARRPLVTAASAFTVFWGVACFDVAGDAFENPDISLFVVDGIILTGGAVALVSQNQELVGRALRRVGGGARNMALRLGLAYPLARRFRTGMILSMYALVVFTLASITLFSRVFAGQIEDFTADVSGGFDLKVASNPSNPLPPDVLAGLDGVAKVAPLAVVPVEFRLEENRDFEFWPTAGFTEAYVEGGPPALEEWDPAYPDAQAAYRAVLADPSLVIVDEFFLQDGGGPPEGGSRLGDTITVRDPASGRVEALTIAALAEAGFDTSFALRSHAGLVRLVGDRAVPTMSYVGLNPDVDAEAFAERLNGRFLHHGADAITFRRSVAQNLSQQQQFMRLMQGYLALGLVVGIAGLGVVMARAVRERRREIGVLRALGFEPSAVRRAFVAESSFVALEGILIGTALAVVSTWRLLTADAFGNDLELAVPWVQMTLLVVLTFGASLLATIAPAQQASRIKPAVALRIAD